MTQLSSATAAWEKLSSLPTPSGNFIAGSIGNDIIVAGGITWENGTKIWLDEIWRFNADKNKWSAAGKLPQSLAYAAAGQTGEGIYFCGGSDGRMTQNGFYLLNQKLELKQLGNVSFPRVYSAAAISGPKLFVVAGGSDAIDLKTLTNTFYSVDLTNGKAENLPEFPGGNLIVPTAAALGEQLFIFTGAYLDADGKPVNVDSSFVYNIGSRTWKKIKSYPVPVRGLASCVLDDRHIFLGGGYTNEFTGLAFIYDIKSDSYLATEPLPFRSMSNLIKAGEYIYWLGGEDKMRHRTDLCYRIRWKNFLNANLRNP